MVQLQNFSRNVLQEFFADTIARNAFLVFTNFHSDPSDALYFESNIHAFIFDVSVYYNTHFYHKYISKNIIVR